MAFRAALERKDAEIVAVNDLLDLQHLAYLLKFDSVRGRIDHAVEVANGSLVVDGRRIRVTAEKDPGACAWSETGADVVIESTGMFLTSERAQSHLRAGARRVILSAPAKDATVERVGG